MAFEEKPNRILRAPRANAHKAAEENQNEDEGALTEVLGVLQEDSLTKSVLVEPISTVFIDKGKVSTDKRRTFFTM